MVASNRSTIAKSLLLTVAMFCMSLVTDSSASAVNAILDTKSPSATNSVPSGIHHHRLRWNTLGEHFTVELRAYLSSNSVTGKSVRFNKINNQCFTRLSPTANGSTNIVSVQIGNTTPIQIQERYLCNNSTLGLFDRNFNLAGAQLDPVINKWYVKVVIAYVNPDINLSTDVDGDNRNAIGFTVNLQGDSSGRLAPFGSQQRNFSVLSNTDFGAAQFRLPFALPCNVAPSGIYKTVIYDADAGAMFGNLEVEIYEKNTDIRIALSDLEGGISRDGGLRMEVTAGNKTRASFTFSPQQNKKYVFKVSQLANGNTVDIGLPSGMETIYGAVSCPPPGCPTCPPQPEAKSVTIEPYAAISQSDIEPGEPTSATAYATVTDFPDLYAQEWPYNEVAIQDADNTGQNATRVTYNAQQGEEAAGEDATKQIMCADGVYRAPSNCVRFQCNDGVDRASCGTYNWQCNRKVSAGGGRINYDSSAVARIPGDAPANCQTSNNDHDIKCADGVFRNPDNCDRFQCNDNVDRASCSTYNWECTYGTDRREVNHSADSQSAMDNCRIFKYFCKDTNGNYITSGTNWQYRTLSGLERAECNNQWDCPAPSPVRGFGSDDASAPCKIFQCAIYTDVSYGTWYEPDGLPEANKRCDFRCGAGRGNHAILSSAGAVGKWDAGDMNCYFSPDFVIGCYISDGAGTVTAYDTVTGNGNWCVRNITVQGSPVIGGTVCSTTTVFTPPNGAAYPGPGKAVDQTWTYSVAGPDSDCVRVVSKPTFKVFGGDVSAGASFASTTCTNDFANSSIVSWSGSATGYNGSHTEYGAFAPGSVFGFASAKRQGGVPSGLTFANTSVSGERFGGDFGAMPCITNHASLMPADAQTMASLETSRPSGSYKFNNNSINTGSSVTIGKTSQYIIYPTGDLTISSNILYDRNGWASLEDIPALKVVVKGDIYISPGVAELNGVYVAQPRDDGSGGRIFTCAGVANNDTFTNCNQTLTVNGAFIAKRVVLGRSFGTQRQGSTAEVFRYLPELWLTKWPQAGSSNSIRYDSMTNLAPVL